MWHQSVDEAKGQAKFEYGAALGSWQEIPDEVATGAEVEFALLKAGG